jgi:NAD(P)H-flavin reductase
VIKTTYTLSSKKNLTHDVYELIYTCPDMVQDIPQPGQYVMFQLAPGLNRSYSIADVDTTICTFTLVIKHIPDGKGSPMICTADIGTTYAGILSLGHFTLSDSISASRCFIGTGTGFAPLYYMVKSMSTVGHTGVHTFLYGVRTEADIFYMPEMTDISKKLDIHICPYLSREDTAYTTRGYVTDWITAENITPYTEFYICGSPEMVKDARTKLEILGIAKEYVRYEQF